MGRVTAAGEVSCALPGELGPAGLWGRGSQAASAAFRAARGDDLGFACLPRITAMSPAYSTQLSSLLPFSKPAGKVSFPGKLLEM